MFKKLDIHLAYPICSCEEQNISWGLPVSVTENGYYRADLRITCQTCGVSLTIPNDQLRASLLFAKPYPKGKKAKEEEEKNNVVPLRLVENEEKEENDNEEKES